MKSRPALLARLAIALSVPVLPAMLTRLEAQSARAEVFTVDQSHSLLDFTVRLVGLNRVRGRFDDWRADFTYDPARPELSSVTFFAEVGSIRTEVEERDEHLKGPDFFNAERFPRIRFQSTRVTANGTGLMIEGDLTIRDVTRRIKFPADLLFPEQRDPFGNRRIVFGAGLMINRREYGVNGPRFWSMAIANEVKIEMEIAGRIWEYSRLNFGRRDAVIGPRLMAAADSGRLESVIRTIRAELENQSDSSAFPTAVEIRTAAMRQYQKGNLAGAGKILEFGFDLAGSRWTDGPRLVNLIGLAEIKYRNGEADRARELIGRALSMDSTNTQAIEWQRLIDASQR